MEILRVNKAIKMIMLDQDISGVDLSRILGIDRTTITRNVGANSNPTVKTLVKYADALNVEVSDIIKMSENIAKGIKINNVR